MNISQQEWLQEMKRHYKRHNIEVLVWPEDFEEQDRKIIDLELRPFEPPTDLLKPNKPYYRQKERW